MRMPVTVAARFADGSEQRVLTDRLADLDELNLTARSPLREVVIEPDARVVLVEDTSVRGLTAKISQMPWTGAGNEALEVYRQAREMKIPDALFWFKLGLALYDGRYYQQALEVMTLVPQGDSDWRFAALVWQGHLLDLLGRRAEAVARYQEALKVAGSPDMRHDQYNLTINKQWVEERLKTPFEGK